MEEIKPKKERKFLKAMGDIALTLFREIVLGIGKKVINKVGNKRQGLVIVFLLVAGISYASIDSIPYPLTGNKQRLGWQTTGNGLVYRGRSNDTITKPTNYVDKNVKAYLILDSVRGTIFVWRQTYWDSLLVGGGGGGGLTMPFDSITFITAKDGTVGVGEVEYNDTQGSLIQGLKGGNVTNVIGQQLHQRVNNRTGATLAKGTAVYLSGSQGNRITVAKALATSDPTSANTFGIVAESIDNNQSGYVITEGLITNINTSALVEDSAVYLSPTVAGGLTSTKPQAPQHTVYIGVCVTSSAGSGELFVSIKNGLEITELHDVRITSPVDRASLYYKSSDELWRDTTAALLVSDTAAMLANYSLKSYVDSISQNFQDSIDEITNGYFKQEFPTVTKDTLNWTKPVQLPIGGSNLLLVYRNGQMINDAQYSVIDTNKVKINSGSYKLGENYTVVYVKGGGGSGSGGVPFDTSVLNLQARLDLKLNISDTAAMLANYATKLYADTTGRFYARQDFSNVSSSTLTWTQSDTLVTGGVNVVQVYRNGQILLPSQYTIPTSTSVVIAATSYKAGENYTVIFPRGGGAGSGGGSGSLTSISAGTGITVTPNPITTTGVVSADLSVLMELTDTSLLNLTSRFAAKQNDIILTTTGVNGAATLSNDTLNIPQYSGGGSVTNIATGYGITGGPITTTGTLVIDSSTIYDFVRDSIVNVQIGRDTIKILKQEYNNVTSDTLTWTTTNKFPIQLRAYILLFRNGQLLINDQYSIIDTNKVKVAATSYKIGENYTLVTVSGIGSNGFSQTGNPIYPESGIAVSTGTTWTTSIPNNSSNWNTAFTDRLKWDGGSTGLTPSTGRTSLGGTTIGQSMFTLTNPSAITFPRFNADNSISALNAASFRSAIGAGTVTEVDASATAGNPISITNKTTTPIIELLSATSSRNGYLTSTDWTTFNNKLNISDTASMLFNYNSRINLKLNISDTAAMLSNYNSRINLKVNISDTTNMLNPYFRDADTTSLNLTTRFAAKQNNLTLTTTGTSGAATLIGSTLNIPQYTGGGGGSGTVTSVGLTAPSIFTVSGSPVTTSGTLALTYSGTALPLLNGGTGATTANDALTNLGATIMGKFLFGLTNSVSDKFIKLNSNNTITLLNAADTRTAIGAGTGTVTSVTSGSTAISVSTGTTTPVISIADASVTTPGVMTNNAQEFLGDKSFYGITTFWGRALFKDYTYVATRLAGLSSTDRFATVTLGSGLSLSAGVLSATSGGVTSVTASTPLSSSGGTTPNITITDAGTGASGVVNTTTQSFAGNKTFTGNVVMQNDIDNREGYIRRKYVAGSAATYTVLDNDTWIRWGRSDLVTFTLPNASDFPGREIYILNIGNGSITSNATNIQQLDGSQNSQITGAGPGKWCTLVSTGSTYWQKMAGN